ncbi:MAG: hypothetical protein M1820_000663 [Bogoriella megaspora]|nr:MAG: hypothetical protein M1820_000663 [Bogoriella megaspora]
MPLLRKALFVLVIREPYSRGVEWPVTTFGAIAFVVLIAGYLPIPFELVKRRGRVVGIDFLFLAIDWSGAFFSLMSLVAQNTFDVIFGTLYALCAAIELSMFLSHGVWLFRTRKLRRKAKEAGVTFDEFPEYTEWQSKATKLNFKIMNLSRSRTDEVSGPDQNAQEAV